MVNTTRLVITTLPLCQLTLPYTVIIELIEEQTKTYNHLHCTVLIMKRTKTRTIHDYTIIPLCLIINIAYMSETCLIATVVIKFTVMRNTRTSTYTGYVNI